MALGIFIAAAVVVAAAFFAALAAPLLRRAPAIKAEDGKAALDARLVEIANAEASGLIAPAAADDLGIEAKRAALEQDTEISNGDARRLRFAAVAFLALAPAAAAGLYLAVGSPSLIGKENAPPQPVTRDDIAAMPEADRQAMIEGMVANLSARLAASPDDPDGWRMLARSQYVLGRPVEAAASYRRLFSITQGTLEDWRNFATMLTAPFPAGAFPTDPEFMKALGEIEARAPDDPMALYYRGGAARETGDPARAVELWKRLLATIPEEAPVRETLVKMIADAEARARGETPSAAPSVPD